MAVALALAATAALAGERPAWAQEEDEAGWTYSAELTAVWVGGNSESNTFGLGSTLTGEWARSSLEITGSALRSESTTTSRLAVGTGGDFTVEDTEDTRKTAESYGLRGRYEYRFGERVFAFGGAEWLRNTFAGIDGKWLGVVGVGRLWVDSDRVHLSTDVGLTFTKQDDVVPDPDAADAFAGLRAGHDFRLQITASARFRSVLIWDGNLADMDDVRLDLTNSLPVAISSKLALKPSLQLLWRNQPSLESVPLVTPAGDPTGESVLVPLEKVDTLFTLALVLTL